MSKTDVSSVNAIRVKYLKELPSLIKQMVEFVEKHLTSNVLFPHTDLEFIGNLDSKFGKHWKMSGFGEIEPSKSLKDSKYRPINVLLLPNSKLICQCSMRHEKAEEEIHNGNGDRVRYHLTNQAEVLRTLWSCMTQVEAALVALAPETSGRVIGQFLSIAELAELYGTTKESIDSLIRNGTKNRADLVRVEITPHLRNEPRFLYRLKAVKPLIEKGN